MIRKEFFTTTSALATSRWLSLYGQEPIDFYQKIVKDVLALGDKGPITLLHPEGCEANLKPVVELFQQLTKVSLQLKAAPKDEINTYILLGNMESKPSFDLALASSFGMPDLIENGAISDLSDLAKKYENENLRKKALYTHSDIYKSKRYGYQADGDVYLMFFHKRFLNSVTLKKQYHEEFGENLKTPETWRELDQQIRFFHRPQKKQYGGCLFRSSFYIAWEWWLRFHAKGFYPFDEGMKAQIDSEAGVKALEELIAITPFLHPHVGKENVEDNFKTFSQGQSYCNLGWGATLKYIVKHRPKLLSSLSYALPPGLKVAGKVNRFSYFNWGSSYTICSKSKSRELAYLFALFASAPLPSLMSVRQIDGVFDPFQLEHYSDLQVQNTYSKAFLTTHKRAMTNCIPDLYMKGQSEYMNALKENIDMALNKKLSPKQAMKITASQWEKITDSHHRDHQIELWQDLKLKYPQKLRSLLN